MGTRNIIEEEVLVVSDQVPGMRPSLVGSQNWTPRWWFLFKHAMVTIGNRFWLAPQDRAVTAVSLALNIKHYFTQNKSYIVVLQSRK